ncbi:MAG: branched-chain amino acid--2-keto-4-methylthiobutyrate aminotransferase, partial [Gammaproteobacteria bacterium]|nr:branched-chain amino acid--2-keto-4-methylthiobutyrate aminotransferase [Gammaproteobacteria bacterium]
TELAGELGIKVDVVDMPVELLREADEAFITSSAGGIMPIKSVDEKILGGGSNPITTRLHNLYWEKRWSGWLGTPIAYAD